MTARRARGEITSGIPVRRIVSALAFFLVFAPPVSAVTITLRDAEIDGRLLRLGAIAEITEADEATRKNLREIVLGYAPPAGTRRAIPIETIRMHVLTAGLLPSEVTIVGRSPFVARGGQRIDGGTISAAVLDHLNAQYPEVNFEIRRVPDEVIVPVGVPEIRVETPKRVARSFFVNVDIIVAEETKRFNVTLGAIRTGYVVTAARPIGRGTVLGEEDLEFVAIDLIDQTREFVGDPSILVGRAAKRPIQPGTPVTTADVEVPRLVDRGEKVQLIVKMPGLRISVSGEAMSPGGLGETIRVRNSESKKIVTGRVTGMREVTVLD